MPLMSYEEYKKNKHPTPYWFSVQFGTRFLYYFGEEHSYDPSNIQWIEEKKIWLEFIKRSKLSKRIVFVEGGRRPVEQTQTDSILNHGGMGFITFLAHKEKISTFSPEPDSRWSRQLLQKQFSRKHIQYYYFARTVHQWSRKQNPKPRFEEYINEYLMQDKYESKWNGFDFSLENMKKIHKDIFGEDFNHSNTEFFAAIVTPVDLTTVINKVARANSKIRNEYIVQEIQKYIIEGYSIFVQYGCSHAVIQEPLIRSLKL